MFPLPEWQWSQSGDGYQALQNSNLLGGAPFHKIT